MILTRNIQSSSFDLSFHLILHQAPVFILQSIFHKFSYLARKSFNNITNLERQIPIHAWVLKPVWYKKIYPKLLRIYCFRIVMKFIFIPPVPGIVYETYRKLQLFWPPSLPALNFQLLRNTCDQLDDHQFNEYSS